MVFVDLNVSWNKPDQRAAIAATAHHLGFDSIVWNVDVDGHIPKEPCPMSPIEYDALLAIPTPTNVILDSKQEGSQSQPMDTDAASSGPHSSCTVTSAPRHALRLQPTGKPMAQYKRLTVQLSDISQVLTSHWLFHYQFSFFHRQTP